MGYMRTPFRWWTGLSPRRRILLGALALLVAVAAVVTGVRVSRGPAGSGSPGGRARCCSFPGTAGRPASLDELAARIRSTGRTATVVPLAGDGTGDLTVQARVLDGYVNQAIGAGSGPVTVIGYSAGGVVALALGRRLRRRRGGRARSSPWVPRCTARASRPWAPGSTRGSARSPASSSRPAARC